LDELVLVVVAVAVVAASDMLKGVVMPPQILLELVHVKMTEMGDDMEDG